MNKKIISLILSLALAFMLALAITSCNEETAECSHTDAEYDGICDKCGKPSGISCPGHTDTNKDKKCDTCGTDYADACTEHTSTDTDGKCDYCGADIECTECVDTDENGKCDYCGGPVEIAQAGSVELVKNGKATFQFVIASEYKSNTKIIQEVDKLITKINSKKTSTERVSDNVNTVKEIEILIGAPASRGDEYKLDGHTLGYNGYSITPIGTKALVLGGSADAIVKAISALEEDLFKITNKSKTLADCTLTDKNSIVETPDTYTVEQVLVAGSSLRDFVIAVDLSLSFSGIGEGEKFNPKDTAAEIQTIIYKSTGIWLPIVDITEDYNKAIILNIVDPDEASRAGFEVKVKGGNMTVECGFPNRLSASATGFFRNEIAYSKKPTVSFNENFSTSVNVRDIKYSDKITVSGIEIGGAVGDGVNDDFFEIKEIHDYANRWGHTVNAEVGKNYYIGFEFARDPKNPAVITVKTDVNWSGARFTIDDTVVPVQYLEHTAGTTNTGICRYCSTPVSEWETTNCACDTDGWHNVPLFSVTSDYAIEQAAANFEGKSLMKGATNIGWEPGKLVLIKIFNDNIKQFIRYGVNENAGQSQQEIILVHPNGDIDESTPLHWNYETVTYAPMVCVEDRPITLTGGTFTNIANLGPNYYYSYGRNIKITRSNVTFRDATHYLDEDTTPATVNPNIERCPYAGFARTEFTNNVRFENLTVTHHTNRYDKGTGALLGTYELGAKWANNVSWVGIRQTNFFEPDGSVSYKGLFGSNFCKNFYFEDCILTSMDAHCGLYNATVIDSTFEHLNFIGEGDIYIKNLTVYADATGVALKLRDDYGSTWNGTVTIDGMDVRYSKDLSKISLFQAKYVDWWFGFETYLPHTVNLNNVKLTRYSQVTTADGERTETNLGTNLIPLWLVSDSAIYNYTIDISKLTTNGGGSRYNAYSGTKLINVTNCGNLYLNLPKTPQFAELKYYVDGALYSF